MYSVILVTAPNKKEAKNIATALVESRLAACVNIVAAVESVFRWQGKVDRAAEILLIIKSQRKKLPRIIRMIKSLHSYKVPEIIALPIIAGEKNYLKWIDECLSDSP